MKDPKKRIVVTGSGLVSCFGNDPDAFYEALLAGKSGVHTLEEITNPDFPTRFGAPVPDFDAGDYIEYKQARRIDPFIKFAIVAGKKSLESAGLYPTGDDILDKERCGIIIGSGMGGMKTYYDGCAALIEKSYKKVSPFFIPYVISNMASGLLAIDCGFHGPAYSVSTACATSNYAIILAANHILSGEADLMVCGGTEAAVCEIGLAGFVANRALSTRNDAPEKASRPWDQDRDGFVMGEGAGMLVLETLEHALKRGAPIIAEYVGGGLSCDAYHMTAPREDGYGIKLCYQKLLDQAGIELERVNYINAHATSTPLGDMSEPRSVHSFFGAHAKNIKMNSTKSMVGHCLGAAGGIEAIATLKAIETGYVHPTINLDNPEPELGDIDVVPNVKQKHDIDVALSNSFGFGGHNSTVAFKAFKD
jgi:3-oxoacyl-[acyl-carrier-protein] synthase II